MSQAATAVSNVKAPASQFIRCADYDQSLVIAEDEGYSMQLGEEVVPLMEMAFNVQIVQQGSVQANPALAGKANKFFIQIRSDDLANPDNIVVENLKLMPITLVRYSFRFFEGSYSNKPGDSNKLLCYSANGLVPTVSSGAKNSRCGVMETKNGETYLKVVCPFATWSDNTKPQCAQYIDLAFLDIERKIPLVLSLHSTGLGAYHKLRRSYKTLKNVVRLKKKSINDYIIDLTLDTSNPMYCVPSFNLVEAGPEFNISELIQLRNYYMSNLFNNPITEESINKDVKQVTQAEVTPVETSKEDAQAMEETVPFVV